MVPAAAEVTGGGHGDRETCLAIPTFPVALGIDLPAIAAETTLTPEQRRALDADLAPDR